MLHTTALMAVGVQAPYTLPVAKMRVPAGLFNSKTLILLLIVLLTAAPPLSSAVASILFMDVVYVVCD